MRAVRGPRRALQRSSRDRREGHELDRSSSFADVFGFVDRHSRQRENRLTHDWLQFVAALCNVVNDLAAHPSFPEIAQMVFYSAHGFIMIRVAGEVGGDVIGHHYEMVDVSILAVMSQFGRMLFPFWR